MTNAVSQDEERSLVEAAKADPAAFVALYERYVHRIFAFASQRTQNRAVAEDVTAEVFEHALANLHGFEWRGAPFSAWLYRIASNAMADRWRREARDRFEMPAELPDGREQNDIERRVLLFQLIERLPDAQRQVVHMRFVEDRSIRDIAQALDRSEGARVPGVPGVPLGCLEST